MCYENCHKKQKSGKVLSFDMTFGGGDAENAHQDDVENPAFGFKSGVKIGVYFKESVVF